MSQPILTVKKRVSQLSQLSQKARPNTHNISSIQYIPKSQNILQIQPISGNFAYSRYAVQHPSHVTIIFAPMVSTHPIRTFSKVMSQMSQATPVTNRFSARCLNGPILLLLKAGLAAHQKNDEWMLASNVDTPLTGRIQLTRSPMFRGIHSGGFR